MLERKGNSTYRMITLLETRRTDFKLTAAHPSSASMQLQPSGYWWRPGKRNYWVNVLGMTPQVHLIRWSVILRPLFGKGLDI